MEFKLFKSGYVALRKNNNWSLYRYLNTDEKSELVPTDFVQNVPYLEVYEESNLVATKEAVFSLNGDEILRDASGIKIIAIGKTTLIVSDHPSERYRIKVQIWNGNEILSEYNCNSYTYSDKYLAVKYGNVWSLYGTDGAIIDECAFLADEVEIFNNLLIVRRLCEQWLYSITQRAFLKQKQLRILCSKTHDFALCAKIGEKKLDIYTNGKWRTLPNVEEFGLVDGIEHIFYIKKKGKYLLYNDNVTRFMKKPYPKGVDFISCNEDNVVLIINNGEPAFYKFD